MEKKLFEISELKLLYLNWLDAQGFTRRETLYDNGQADGVENFLFWIEDEWNKKSQQQ